MFGVALSSDLKGTVTVSTVESGTVVPYSFNPFDAAYAPSLAYVRPNYSAVGGVGTWLATAGGDNLTGAPAAVNGAPLFATTVDFQVQALSGSSPIETWLGTGDHHVVAVIDGLTVASGEFSVIWTSADFAAAAWLFNNAGDIEVTYQLYDSANHHVSTVTPLGAIPTRAVLQFKKDGGFLWVKIGAAAWVKGGAVGSTYTGGAPTNIFVGGDPYGDNTDGTMPAFGTYKAAQSDAFADAVVTWAAVGLS